MRTVMGRFGAWISEHIARVWAGPRVVLTRLGFSGVFKVTAAVSILVAVVFWLCYLHYRDDWPREYLPYVGAAFLLSVLAVRLADYQCPPWYRQMWQPFPSWNLFLVIGAILSFIFPWSETLRWYGYLPMLVLLGLFVHVLFSPWRGFELGRMALAVGLILFAWLWQIAGVSEDAVPPVDLPAVQNQSFSPGGVSRTLQSEIKEWLLKPPAPQPTGQFSSMSAGQNPTGTSTPVPATFHPLADTSATVQGLNLEWIYHELRHLRHKPTIEAQILLGGKGDFTLALRASDIPANCFNDRIRGEVAEELLSYQADKARRADDVVLEFRKIEDRKVKEQDTLHLPLDQGCDPSWGEKTRQFLGISDIPGETEARISNVTDAGPISDEKLTQLLHLAILEGMSAVRPDLAGYYYATHGGLKAAYASYERALPWIVARLLRSPSPYKERFQADLSNLFMTIAKFEGRPRSVSEQGDPTAFKRALNHARIAALLDSDHVGAALEYPIFLIEHIREECRAIGDRRPCPLSVDYSDVKKALEALPNASGGVGSPPSAPLGRIEGFPPRWFALAYAEISESRDLQGEKKESDLEEAEKNLKEGCGPPSPHGSLCELLRLYVADGKGEFDAEQLDQLCTATHDVPTELDLQLRMILFEDSSDIADKRESSIQKDRESRKSKCTETVDLTPRQFLAAGRDSWRSIYYEQARLYEMSVESAKRSLDDMSCRSRGSRTLAGCAKVGHDLGRVEAKLACYSGADQDRKWVQTGLDEARSDLEVLPPDPYAQLALADLTSTAITVQPQQLADAQREAENLARKYPDVPAARSVLAGILLRQGRLPEAEQQALAAVRDDPDDPDSRYVLGAVFDAEGQADRASEQWDYERALDPERWETISNQPDGCRPVYSPVPRKEGR